MDINDYSTKLSQARMKYNDANNEVRKNYKENLENLEDLHEAKEARRMIHQNPASFVDFTTKFSDLID